MSFAHPYASPRIILQGRLIFGSLFILALSSHIDVYGFQPPILQTGSVFTSEIRAKESQSVEFDLDAGELIRITATSRGNALLMRVLGKNGDTLLEVPYHQQEPVTWIFIAPETDRYRLTVSSLHSDGQAGRFELRVDEIRRSTSPDRNRAAAWSGIYRAEVLQLRWENSDLEKALVEYHSAADALKKIRDWAGVVRAWQGIGEVRFVQGDYNNALQAFSVALDASQKTNNTGLKLTQLNQLAYVHISTGNFERAETLLAQVRSTLTRAKGLSVSITQQIQAQLENNYGEIELARGDLTKSRASFARALVLWKELDNLPGMARAHLNNGYAFLDSGNANEAMLEFDESLKLCRNSGDLRSTALTLTAKGNLYTFWGETYLALSAHREARDIFRRIGDRQGEAVTSNGLGKVFEDLNRKQEAVDNYSHALRLNHEIGNRNNEAVTGYYLGRVWNDLGDWKRSVEFYERSLTMSLKAGKNRMAALARTDVAGIYVKQGKHAEALKLYRETLQVYKQIGDLRRQAITHQGLGKLFRTRGELNEANTAYELSRELFHRIRDPQGEAESLYLLASVAQQQNDLPRALTHSQKSIDLIEAQRNRVIGQNWRSSYFAAVRRHFELHVDILMQVNKQSPGQGFDRLAFEASERARARSLLELLMETKTEIRRNVDQSLLDRERQLGQQLSAKANYQMKALERNFPDEQLAALEREIRTLNADYDFVQAQIKAQDPHYAQLIQPTILNTEQIQATLAEDGETALLQYMLGEKRSYVWLVTPGALISRELPGRAELKDLTANVYKGLTARQQLPGEELHEFQKRSKADEQLFCPNASELSSIVLEPLRDTTKVRRLLVVPDGNLQYIPFEALPLPTSSNSTANCRLDSEPADYVPLLTEYDIVHLHSFSALATLRQPRRGPVRPSREIAVWADPVFEADDPRIHVSPNNNAPDQLATGDSTTPEPDPPPARLLATIEEAQSIMRLAPTGMSLIFTGFEATRESALNENLNDYRILHFATHSLVNNRYPALTGLWLSTFDQSGVRRNGLLQLHDIYGLRLNSDLVVLSGCQTGLGQELSGEGLIGLTQAFLHAGSKSVVVSLWKVQDKTTAVLMTNFYQAMLEKGVPPSMALREAKLQMYRHSEWRSPYYWSAFVLQGEFRASQPLRPLVSPRKLMASVAVLGLTLWLVFSRVRSRRRLASAGMKPISGGRLIE